MTSVLAPGELVLLYSDGLVERPDQTIAEGMAELAVTAAGAARESPPKPPGRPPGRTRCASGPWSCWPAGRADDITALAAQRLTEPVPDLHLGLPSERPSLTIARDAFAGWLPADATADDWEALHLALVEVFTNAIEHAYPGDEPGTIELEASLRDDGYVECRVTDHGSWRPPDPADADRGHGLMVAGQVVDHLLVRHPQAAESTGGHDRDPAAPARPARHHRARAATARRPLIWPGRPSPWTPPSRKALRPGRWSAARSTSPPPISWPGGYFPSAGAAQFPLVADLTGVTPLASAGVRALYAVSGQMAAHGQDLTLITAPGSAAQLVLDLVRLAHVAGSES